MSKRPRIIPDDALRVQIETSDPEVSAWVSANAGSGKTYVLAQRVIRLMLAGTPPAKILCLTFTKAAAANMANQVFDALAKWITLDDAQLDRAIMSIEGRWPDAVRRARARRLFAEALDTPGGLKAQTIHAFCTRLLHQFPFEANVAARFTVLEERAEKELLERLRLEVLLEAAGDPDGPLGRALETAISASADRTFGVVVDAAITQRDRLTAWITAAGGIDGAVAELSSILGIGRDDTLERVEAEIAESPFVPFREWPQFAAMLGGGLPSDCAQAYRLASAAKLAGESRNDLYSTVFLTETFAPRKQLVTKAIATRHPALAERLCQEQDRIVHLVRRRWAVRARDRTEALLRIASAVIERYRSEKQARGVLDYDDLIDKTLALMTEVEAAWVHYKLDLGIDHVLIDEAQDTSPKQWDIIRKLTAEFTAGEGARGDVGRSIFAVGDEKQSIFSFQGAAPDEFAANRRHFEQAHREAELAFLAREFKHSFRSGANVLSAVDAVFRDQRVYVSVTTDEAGIPPHIALPDAMPGMVEIWPCIEATKRDEVEAWDAPFDEVGESSPQVRLAVRIAATARAMIRDGRRPGDILVLVRQRGPVFEAVLRALKNAGVAVAGADRLVLTDHIAVMDLLALADALLLRPDDLALAAVLKSPLFGFDDDLLFRLAWRRNGTLRARLAEKAGEDPRFAHALEKLDRLADIARRETPFGFFARVLGRERGRRQMLARLGAEAADALDEFLSLALDYEAREAPSLQGFVDHMRASATEVKRDMDIARDEVRVMTVHGAKGLEAPVVILADTTTRPTGPHDPRLLALDAPRAPAGTPPRLVWAAGQDQDVDAVAVARAQARRAAEDEYRRLLYVAMTRAAELLIVCGAKGLNGKPFGCWYDLVLEALAPMASREMAADGQGEVWRWRQEMPPADATPSPPAAATGELLMPAWLTRDAASAPDARTISPSTAAGDDQLPERTGRVGGGDRERAIERGLLVHRLVRALPDVSPEHRVETARRFLARNGAHVGEVEREAMVAQVLAVLTEPHFGPLFGPGTMAEVPIVGRLARGGRAPLTVSGQVDRLLATDDAVLVADYKTNRPPPRDLGEVPPGYITQLALYRAVLGRLYPGREVRAALVWTEIPDLMEIPGPMLDTALSNVLER